MKDTTKQTQTYAWMLALAQTPIAERHNVIKGASVFFDRGWPSNHFTVGMAARAGMGLVPPIYNGIGSEGLYFYSEKDASEGSLVSADETEAEARA
jgi:hypothetical protein